MKDTHWLDRAMNVSVHPNEVTSALMSMYDIRRALPRKIKSLPLSDDNESYTIGDCVADVILFLEELEKELQDE